MAEEEGGEEMKGHDICMLVSCIAFVFGIMLMTWNAPWFRDPIVGVVRMLGWLLNMGSLIVIWELWKQQADEAAKKGRVNGLGSH